MAHDVNQEAPPQRDKFVERVVSIVHPWSMIYANTMADNDPEILKVERYIDTLTFDASDVPHFIEWGPKEDLLAANEGQRREELLRPEIFNNPDWMRKLRPILSRARVLARRFGFVGMWVLDEERITNWLVAYLKADAHARTQIELPFGVVEPTAGLFVNCRLAASELAGAGMRVPMARLEVEYRPPPIPGEAAPKPAKDAGNKVAPPGVNVYVYTDVHLQYRTPSDGQVRTMVNAIQQGGLHADVMHHVTARLGPDGASRAAPYVLPSTGLFELLTQRRLLDAALRRREMVEGTNAQGLLIVHEQAVKLTPDAERRLSQQARAMGTEVEAMLGEHSMRQVYTHEEWLRRQEILNRMINPLGMGGGTDELPVSQLERLRAGAPHPVENRVTLTDGIQLAHLKEPALTVDVEVLKENYRRDVAETLGLGLAILQQFNNGGRARPAGGAGGATTANFASIFNAQQQESDLERHLMHVVQTERNWMASFFSVLYARMMGPLDMALVDHMNAQLHAQRANMREAKLAARAMEAALAREMSLVDDEQVMSKYKQAVAAGGTKQERRRLKTRIVEYRNMAEKMRVATDSAARLVFQPASTDRMARQLQILLEAFWMNGLIDEKPLAPFVKAVFGPTIPLKKDAVSPAQRDQVQLAGMKSEADLNLTDKKGEWDLKREREKAKFNKDKGPPKKKAKKK
jgi:hypothetical protein